MIKKGKLLLYPILNAFGCGAAFRYLNKNKLLIVVYHGISANLHDFQPFTLLPVTDFERHIRFLKTHYTMLSLKETVWLLTKGKKIPSRTAIVTFDDGYCNNLTHALPIIQKYQVPITIFLTAGYIGTKKLLPFDQAYLICRYAQEMRSRPNPEIGLPSLSFKNELERCKSFSKLVSLLKKLSTSDQERCLLSLRQELYVPDFTNKNDIFKDFQLMSWEDAYELKKSGLVDFGSHTLSHEILTNVTHQVAEKEISFSKSILEKKLNEPITLFAYPNGRQIDFNSSHMDLLNKYGYSAAVTTIPDLNTHQENIYKLKRMNFGSGFSANLNYFVLRTSGFLPFFKNIVKHVYS